MVKEIHSHAHEEGIPGTVNLKAVEGDDTYLGQALFPVPSNDPNDPLNWPQYKYIPRVEWELTRGKLRSSRFVRYTHFLETHPCLALQSILLFGLKSLGLTSELLRA